MAVTYLISDAVLVVGGLTIWIAYAFAHVVWRHLYELDPLDRTLVRFRLLLMLVAIFYSSVVLARSANTGRDDLVAATASTMGVATAAFAIMTVGAFHPDRIRCEKRELGEGEGSS